MKLPPIGTILLIAEPNQPNHQTRVVNIIGRYVVLEDGTKFHASDDSVGPRAWHVNGKAISYVTPAP